MCTYVLPLPNHPQNFVQFCARLQEEIETVLENRETVTVEDLNQLQYTEQVSNGRCIDMWKPYHL